MKLLTKTSLHYLWASLALLAVFGCLLFVLLKKEVSDEIREQLELETKMITADIQDGQVIRYPLIKIAKTSAEGKSWFRDTSFYDHAQKVTEEYYVLTSYHHIQNEIYAITVITAYIGWDEYFKTIGITFFCLGLLLVISGIGINYLISQQIWKPFLTNLVTLKKHSPSTGKELALDHSDIDEFKELNIVLQDFAYRAKEEYHVLQEFTENSSHELQTPISMIRARLESLGQLPLSDDGVRFLNDAKMAIDRLNKVNKGLVLLTRLKGGQFPDVQSIALHELLWQHINQLEDFYTNRNLQINVQAQECSVEASPQLVDMLISNLLSNQFRHAEPGTVLHIKLNKQLMEFSNEGAPLPFHESQLFKRFVKGSRENSGIGLGLSIVSQICKLHHWDIRYSYQENRHVFQVVFK